MPVRRRDAANDLRASRQQRIPPLGLVLQRCGGGQDEGGREECEWLKSGLNYKFSNSPLRLQLHTVLLILWFQRETS